MQKLPRILAFFAIVFPAVASALDWENERLEIEATALDERAVGNYEFTNGSDVPVTITSIRSSCGCTVPDLEKRTYAPGESGSLKAVFNFGSRTGLQVKTITVQTDEPQHSTYTFTLQVVIPKLFSVDRRFVVWRKGDELASKNIVIKVLDSDTAGLAGVESGDQRIKAELESTNNPNIFHLVVTPRQTENSLQATITVKTDFPEDNPRVLTVYALVR